jgi:hypothetical protein
MGFWPFGREPADVELASRVITAATQNGFRVRGKLTVHFDKPQRQADADAAIDRCAIVANAVLRDAPNHEQVIGAEAQLGMEIFARYPLDIPRARAVRLEALHVVGDPALSDELRRAHSTTGSMPPISAASPSSSRSGSTPPPRASANPPLTGPTSSGPPPMRRRGSSQIRSIQSLLLPPGTPPAAIGAFVAPLMRDSAARLLIGFLRAHDLIALRGVAVDEGSAEMLATLVPVSDAPPGGYEASRSGEIARWQALLGTGVIDALHRRAEIACIHLAREGFALLDVPRALVEAVLDAACQGAFTDRAGVFEEAGRAPAPAAGEFVEALARAMTRIAAGPEDPASIAAALAPLVTLVRDDFAIYGMVIKQSAG